jgi:drug/metabolite transporter (DMT)-like permease
LAWALLGLLGLIWGGSFLANRAALAEVPVLTVVAFRVTGAAVLLWAYVAIRGLPVPRGPRIVAVFFGMGLLNNVLPFSLIVWGQQHIASGLAGILNAATAVFTVLLVALIFPDERLTGRKAVGVTLGFLGVATAVGLHNLAALNFASLGQMAVLGATIAYALSGVFGRIFLKGIRPEVSAAGMLAASACVMVPAALAVDGPPALDYGPGSWIALAYLACFASALAYILFYAVLGLAGAGNLSLVTLLVAPIAIVLGALVYGEALRPSAYLGFALLALGLLVIDGRLLRVRPRSAQAR